VPGPKTSIVFESFYGLLGCILKQFLDLYFDIIHCPLESIFSTSSIFKIDYICPGQAKKIQPKVKEISISIQSSHSWCSLYLFLNHILQGQGCEFGWISKLIYSLLCLDQWWFHVWGLAETPRKANIYQGMVIAYCFMITELQSNIHFISISKRWGSFAQHGGLFIEVKAGWGGCTWPNLKDEGSECLLESWTLLWIWSCLRAIYWHDSDFSVEIRFSTFF